MADLGTLLAAVSPGFSVVCEDRPSRTGEIGVLKLSAVSRGHLRPEENKVVAQGNRDYLKRPLTAGTILMSRSNTAALVGACVYVDADYPNLYLPDLLWELRVRDADDCDPRWLAYLLSSDRLRRVLTARAGGTSGSMKKLAIRALRSIRVPVPPGPEQRSVAAVLRTWDAAITTVEDLIRARIRQRAALIGKLLGWEEQARGQLGEFLVLRQRPVAKPDHPYTAVSVRSHGKGLLLRGVEDPAKVLMDRLYEVHEGDLVVNITFGWEGAIAVATREHHGALVSHRFPTYVLRGDLVLPGYLRYLILTKRFVYELARASPGGAGRNRVLNKNDFLKIEVPVPSRDRQAAVCALLESVDMELRLLKHLGGLLRRQKKALMQLLLSGHVLVKE